MIFNYLLGILIVIIFDCSILSMSKWTEVGIPLSFLNLGFDINLGNNIKVDDKSQFKSILMIL